MELKLKEPSRLLPTVSEQDFQTFIDSIHMGQDPNGDPSGFRDRLLCLLLKEGGFRIGEILGLRMEDLEFGKQGVHIRFRPDNEHEPIATLSDRNYIGQTTEVRRHDQHVVEKPS